MPRLRIEPEDVAKMRAEGGDLSDIRLLRHIERIDHGLTHMMKVWDQIQENLRKPWQQKGRP